MELIIIVSTFLISSAIALPVGMVLRKKVAESKIESAENEAKRLIENANKEAENKEKKKSLKLRKKY